RVGALAGRSAGTVGDRDKARPQRLEPLDRDPQPLLHLRRLRREELEGNARRPGIEIADRVGAEETARDRAWGIGRRIHPWRTRSARAATGTERWVVANNGS